MEAKALVSEEPIINWRFFSKISPILRREGGCEKIDLVLFHVIPDLIRNPVVVPANSGNHIKNWAPVFTGVTAKFNSFTASGDEGSDRLVKGRIKEAITSYRTGYFVCIPNRVHDVLGLSGVTNEVEVG